MNYKTAIVLALLFTLFAASIGIAVGVYNFLTLFLNPPKVSATQKIACAQDTFKCQNGQTVSRIKPLCQFAQCPITASSTSVTATSTTKSVNVLDWSITGTALGKVLLLPNCSPEKEATDPKCEPEGRLAELVAYGTDGKEVEKVTTSKDGTYSMTLPVGKYLLRVVQIASTLKCEDKVVTIVKNDSSLAAILCSDTAR